MKLRMILIVLIAFLLLGGVSSARANPQTYGLPWWKVAGGGGDSQGGSYLLQGTAGQSEAGTLAGGHYTLEGGFWSALQPGESKTFLPFLTRSH